MGATYYIDLVSGSNANPGTKVSPWLRAPGMTGFSATYSHAAGDQFIFKGGQTCGTTGTPCFTSWTISNSGSGGAGSDYYGVDQTWYAGASWSQPVIDGGHLSTIPSGTDYITISGAYITLDNIRIQDIGIAGVNQDNRAITLLGSTPHDILIENMTLAVQARIAIAIILNGSSVLSNWEFKNNDFSKCSWGIGGGPDLNVRMDNVLIHDNTFHDFHDQMANDVHGNGLYLYGTSGGTGGTATNARIYNNVCYGDFSKSDASTAAMTSCLWLSAGYGAEYMYNNRATGSSATGGFSRCLQMNGQDSTYRVTAYIYNNSCYLTGTDSNYGVEVDQAIVATVQNNIFVGGTQAVAFGIYTAVDSVISNYNDLYQFASYCANVNASDYQLWSQFRTAGYEANGFNASPLFVSPTDTGSGGNLRLQASSPLISAGINLSSVFTTDAAGTTRPSSGAWTIGAYQYVPAGGSVSGGLLTFSGGVLK
tara:strand:+ start:847 stop:2286 length:1440 start_codon:yes stop_codon:yes gene_type:complete